MLVQGTPYAATYYNATNEWILQGFLGAPGIPLGVALPYFGATAPASAFALPFGQAISRTTYANLFALLGTTYGAGDGSTTFNIPDLRGYVLAGKDDMGGSAANRITNAGSGITGTTLGATGGAETVTLTTAQMPAHSHGVTDPGHGHGVTVTDPGHSHPFTGAADASGAVSVQGGSSSIGGTSSTSVITTGISASANGNTTGISVNNAGSGGAHTNMPPTRICNFIMRILRIARR